MTSIPYIDIKSVPRQYTFGILGVCEQTRTTVAKEIMCNKNIYPSIVFTSDKDSYYNLVDKKFINGEDSSLIKLILDFQKHSKKPIHFLFDKYTNLNTDDNVEWIFHNGTGVRIGVTYTAPATTKLPDHILLNTDYLILLPDYEPYTEDICEVFGYPDTIFRKFFNEITATGDYVVINRSWESRYSISRYTPTCHAQTRQLWKRLLHFKTFASMLRSYGRTQHIRIELVSHM